MARIPEKQDWTRLSRQMGAWPKDPWYTSQRLMRSLVSWGFRELALGLKVKSTGGPGEPPEGFVGGTTSLTEWYVYWAFKKLLGPEGNNWTFQESFAGGRHIPGGSVADFVLYMPMQTIIVRVQTWRFHSGAGSDKNSRDLEQKVSLHTIFGEEIVVDIYEQYFINDDTGFMVLEVCKDAMAGLEWPDPVSLGIAGDW